jgi:hypothetical protein
VGDSGLLLEPMIPEHIQKNQPGVAIDLHTVIAGIDLDNAAFKTVRRVPGPSKPVSGNSKTNLTVPPSLISY